MDKVIYQQGDYSETVIEECDGVRIVNCVKADVTQLYRVEYSGTNCAFYDIGQAYSCFDEKSQRPIYNRAYVDRLFRDAETEY
jgi:hypothetical protein